MPEYLGTDPNTGYDVFGGGTTVVHGRKPVNWLDALFPRLTASTEDPSTLEGTATNIVKGIADAGSAPGRFYAAMARPDDESYLHAAARTAPDPTEDNGVVSDAAESVLRDPLTLMAPGVGKALEGTGLIMRGLGQAALAAGNNVANDQPISGEGAAMAAGGEALPAIAQGIGHAMLPSDFRQPPQFPIPYNRLPGTPAGDAYLAAFGNSQAILDKDPNHPLTLWHSTSGPGFDAFDPRLAGSHLPADDTKAGWIFGHTNPKASATYLGPMGEKDYLDAFREAVANPEKYGLSKFQEDQLNYVLNRYDPLSNTYDFDLPTVAQYNNVPVARKGTMIPGYLAANKVLSINMNGGEYNPKIYRDLIATANAEGHDAIRVRNVYDVLDNYGEDPNGLIGDVFMFKNPNIWKSPYNMGTWDLATPNMYKFAGEKGGTELPAPNLLGRTAGKVTRNAIDTLLQGSNQQGDQP